MTVVAIAAALSAVAVPHLSHMFAAAPEAEEVENLRRAFVETRNRTILSDVCAALSLQNNVLTATVFKTCGSPPSNPLDSKTYTFRKLTIDGFDQGLDTLEFLQGGALQIRRPVTLSFKTATGRFYELRTLPAIGNIRLKEVRK
jgi:hypothetical protein